MHTISGESALFLASDQAPLLYKPARILRVFQPLTGQVFKEGTDYAWEPGTSFLRRLPGSAIAELTEAEMFPAEATAHPYPKFGEESDCIGGKDGKLLWFGCGTNCMKKQFEIDYETEDAPLLKDLPQQLDRLPKFRAKLAAGKPLLITAIGDSITDGFNATKRVESTPFTPPYIEQFAIGIQSICNATVTLQNNAISGTGVQHAMMNISNWQPNMCDLMVIAYGMNNYSSMPAEDFIKYTDEIIRRKLAGGSDTEILLVSTMSGNENYNGPRHIEYGEAMRKYVATAPKAVALADVHQVWQEILKRKPFLALTGNGVNHPNDFGHRIYASVLMSLFR